MKLRHLLSTALLGLALMPMASQAADDTVELRFVMAHKPDNPDNVALIQEFADRVGERTAGTVHITPIMPEQMKGNSKRASEHTLAFNQLYSGEVEMGQVSVKKFFYVAPEMQVLDMPLLFTDHAHVAKVLDGPIGKDLLETVSKGSNGNIRSLAFTYSGGFRNLYTTKPIASLSDVRGMTTRFPGSTMTRDLVDFLGIKTTVANIGSRAWFNGLADKSIGVEEAELIRLAVYERQYPDMFKTVNTVLETNHNLFLTTVSINGPIFDRLSKEQQAIIRDEAEKLSIKERELSIKQADEAKEMFQKQYGIKFVQLSDDDRALLRKVSRQVYAKHNDELGGWMQAIAEIDPHSAYAAADFAK